MKPAPFDYHAPHTLEEAIGLLASLENAKVLAGGQSLVPMLNFRYVIVDHLVDLAKVEGLAGFKVANGVMRIGAMTRQRDLEFSKDVAEHIPLLQVALKHVGHRQTRNRGTIGGSLVHADPAAEQPAVCAAYDAIVEIAGKRGTRKVKFSEFGGGFMSTVVEPDEIVTAIEIPLWPKGHGYGFHEFARRRGDFAIVGAAVLLDVNDDKMVKRASLALCGVATAPMRLTDAEAALIGKSLDAASVNQMISTLGTLEPISDIHATSDYRRHLAAVLLTRALRDAAAVCNITI
ncbi:MAG: xanthine dehydrogenase family protein subunit M [Pseudorhodoplanes sp.]|jgi:carbon-monoxide dehydrogenase medium subunit|nr:xanthine dehydrogenase family protein subunit M [Pseudorhodoplanes sp.]